MAVLSEMGIPLRSTSGPGGGYSLPRGGRRLSPSLTVDEALALIVSYEALLRYPVSPFSAEGVSAVTKLRAALPADVVGELDALREHVAIVEPVRDYEAPLLGELLSRRSTARTWRRPTIPSAPGSPSGWSSPSGSTLRRGSGTAPATTTGGR